MFYYLIAIREISKGIIKAANDFEANIYILKANFCKLFDVLSYTYLFLYIPY